MAKIFTCILLLLSLSGTFTKYVYVKEKLSRLKAQTSCRQTYTDLAPVSNINDVNKLHQLSSNTDFIWIGLERNCSNRTQWLWSGGGAASFFFWAPNEPNDLTRDEDYAFIKDTKSYDVNGKPESTFFCYRAVVVMEEKTWEDALEYCRKNHNDLASVASETEMLLMQRELKKSTTTEHVWIGLRFLSADWLWVDGQELDYEDWGQEGKPSCPDAKMKCGALQVMGGNQSDPNQFLNNGFTADIGVNDALNVITGQGVTVASENGVWGARDCEQRLNFICY